jgi:thiamine kinase-like enzyme
VPPLVSPIMDHTTTALAPSAPAADALLARLEQLSFLQKPILLEPLSGGITNQNFLVRSPAGHFVARLCQPRPHLGIDRRNESICHDIAANLGLAPPLIHRDHDLLIYPWVAGRSFTIADLLEPDQRARVAALLGHLHAAWDTLDGEILYFCAFQTIRTYARTAATRGAELPGDLPATLEDLRQLSRAMTPFRPVLCHNDLLPANLIDDGNRLWLVDWEYAGIGHPLFDLANLAANAGLSDEQDQELLNTYTDLETAPAQLAEFRVLKAASSLRESLWASIQTVTATIDFDYTAYAHQNYTAYLHARSRLDQPLT